MNQLLALHGRHLRQLFGEEADVGFSNTLISAFNVQRHKTSSGCILEASNLPDLGTSIGGAAVVG